jgi:hypothetical protein
MPTGDSSTAIATFESHRHFHIWRYEVGHAQLLLRSVKGDHHASRIDVLFKAIDLPTKFDGLQIERDGYRYAVSGADWSGCVIAGACFQAEDAGEYYNPSPFALSMPGA